MSDLWPCMAIGWLERLARTAGSGKYFNFSNRLIVQSTASSMRCSARLACRHFSVPQNARQWPRCQLAQPADRSACNHVNARCGEVAPSHWRNRVPSKGMSAATSELARRLANTTASDARFAVRPRPFRRNLPFLEPRLASRHHHKPSQLARRRLFLSNSQSLLVRIELATSKRYDPVHTNRRLDTLPAGAPRPTRAHSLRV